MIGEVVVK